MYLVCFVESLLPWPGFQTSLTSLGENNLWEGGVEQQCGGVVGDGLVVSLSIHCCISEELQLREGTLPEI